MSLTVGVAISLVTQSKAVSNQWSIANVMLSESMTEALYSPFRKLGTIAAQLLRYVYDSLLTTVSTGVVVYSDSTRSLLRVELVCFITHN